jgi:hypothetical protein
MSTSWARRLLTLGRYSELRTIWDEALAASPEAADVETGLVRAADEFDRLSDVRPRGAFAWDRSTLLQSALGEFYFFAFELLRESTRLHRQGNDSYRRLCESWAETPFSVVTLNYDTLFEQSAQAAGRGWCHAPILQPSMIPIAKVHGSINWFNPCSGFISYGDGAYSEPLFKQVAKNIYSNSAWTRPLRSVPLEDVPELRIENIVRSGGDYDHPAILPPFGSHKLYAQVRIYADVWNHARQFLSDADRLVVIGAALRPEDSMLVETLSSCIRPGSEIVAVGGTALPDRLAALMPTVRAEDIPFYPDFSAYVSSI